MYQLIYDFLLANLFNGGLQSEFEIGGATLTMDEWLAHTCTMVSMVLMFAFFVVAIVWVFKMVAGLIGGLGR